MREIFANKKSEVLILLGLIIIMLISITYGAFFITRLQSGNNDITSGCFSTSFSNESESISLIKTLPMSDSEGINTTPYSFTLTNTCNLNIDYYVIASSTANSITDNNIKYQFNNESVDILSNAPQNTFGTDSGYADSRIIGSGHLSSSESTIINVRLWLSNTANYDDVLNQSWSGQIKVVSKPTND